MVVHVLYFPSYKACVFTPHTPRKTSQVIRVTTAAISWRNGYLYQFFVRHLQALYVKRKGYQVERPLGIVRKEEWVSHPSELISFSGGTLNTAYLVLAPAAFEINTLRTGDADLRFYITTEQDGWRKSAFLKRACFPCTIHLIMQYIEPVSE